MKNTRIALFCLLSVPFVVLAQTNTNSIPVPPGAVPGTAPGLGLLLALVPILTPIIITVLKWAVPKIPAVAIPLAAPLLGMAIDWLSTLATHGTANPLLAAIAGAAGTGVYEAQKQLRQQVSKTQDTPPTT